MQLRPLMHGTKRGFKIRLTPNRTPALSSRLMEDQRKADGFGQPSLAPIAGDEVTAVQVLGRGDVQNIHRARTQLRGISFRQ